MNNRGNYLGYYAALLAGALALNAFPSGAGPALTNCCQHACCARNEPLAAYTERSLYQLESQWTNDAGKFVRLSELGDRPQVVAMFFANCEYACPLIVNDMRRIEAALTPEQRSHVGFALISFDSKRDTAAALAEYRRVRGLPEKTWTLLHGEPDEVMELAALLGDRYKQDARGQFSHSNVITVLNSAGEIVHQQIGLNGDVRETVSILGKLVAEGNERETSAKPIAYGTSFTR